MEPTHASKLTRGGGATEHRVYPIRFLVCFVIAINNIFNAMIWITFASVQERTAAKYNVSQTAINMFSFTFLILYVPGTFLCSFMFKKYGLRHSFIFSSFLQFLSTILRYISLNSTVLSVINLDNNDTNYHIPYIISIIGTCFAGLIQPFYTNSPARVAAQWFSVDGRDVATALLSLVNPIGIGLGTFLPTIFISPIGENNNYGGYPTYLLIQSICAFIGFIFTILFVKNEPPTPPSASQRLKIDQLKRLQSQSNNNVLLGNKHRIRSDDEDANNRIVNMKESRFLNSFESSFLRIKQDFNENILYNKQFYLLCGGFGVGLGFFNALTTLIAQYTAAFGYNSNQAGIFGGLLILGGIIGAIISGAAMEIFKKYNPILKSFVIGTVIVAIIFVTQMKENNIGIVNTLFCLFGFCAVPIICVTFECAAECTYPCDEEISSGILMSIGNLLGVVFLLLWGNELPNANEEYNNMWNFSTYFIFVIVALVAIFFGFYNGEYKRLNQESANLTANSKSVMRPHIDRIDHNNSDRVSVAESLTSGHGKIVIDDRQMIM